MSDLTYISVRCGLQVCGGILETLELEAVPFQHVLWPPHSEEATVASRLSSL